MNVLTLVVRVMIFVRSVPSFNENDFFFPLQRCLESHYGLG